MKVLLTGASGFVGSHILESLRARGLPTAVLLRPTSDRRFIQPHLSAVEVRTGAVGDPASLQQAMDGITHVIHCAGATKVCRNAEFYEVNQGGTRNVVAAINAQAGRIERLVHISSLAVAGPATRERPAREADPTRPISEYGKSKLAAEVEVKNACRAPFVILRPAAVYGPRDTDFLHMFRAVRRHILPTPSGAQALSLAFVRDVAEAVVTCLAHPGVVGKTYFVSAEEIVTARLMAAEIAARMQVWTLPLPLPAAVLWPVCLAQDACSRLTRKPSILNLQKYAELRAPGWVCDARLLEQDTGYRCPTTLGQGVAETLAWYQQQRWL
ncbi:MAG TPA: NAD-dependent epimerase/dehydratase family protein [Candidatus Acidoferrum sp.]|nr:NAD-dependent epimerase/dehydratase family protein [Candidatus Acidoferrum sp.]